VLLVIACALAAIALAGPASASKPSRGGTGYAPIQPQTNLPDVEDEVMCTTCGTLLELSESPQADRERAFIRREIAQGKTKSEIEDDLVANYGPEVLATPGGSGFDLAAWLVPGLAILLAAIAIAIGLRRWRRAGRARAAAEPQGEAAPLSEEDKERLDADLARYDL
jgi:cytochrome c-type biogenesis protein CcmH